MRQQVTSTGPLMNDRVEKQAQFPALVLVKFALWSCIPIIKGSLIGGRSRQIWRMKNGLFITNQWKSSIKRKTLPQAEWADYIVFDITHYSLYNQWHIIYSYYIEYYTLHQILI